VYTLFVPPSPPTPGPGKNLFSPLLLWLCWRENLRDSKKKILFFFLVWTKDSYTEIFVMFLPCTCVSQPPLVCYFQTSSLLPDLPPIVDFANLRLLYSLFSRKHINRIQKFRFSFLSLFLPCMFSLRVWPMSNYITTAFVLGL
jgi:hypothetical protein